MKQQKKSTRKNVVPSVQINVIFRRTFQKIQKKISSKLFQRFYAIFSFKLTRRKECYSWVEFWHYFNIFCVFNLLNVFFQIVASFLSLFMGNSPDEQQWKQLMNILHMRKMKLFELSFAMKRSSSSWFGNNEKGRNTQNTKKMIS